MSSQAWSSRLAPPGSSRVTTEPVDDLTLQALKRF
jgi:hypothetical protein